ncbi:MAPEG family protein [Amphibiibacter pelophylacis]|uniref:MAPEG family protein n=1 Tax=Amphibiibacter pelophylacis TaxID=1799477 RepID=A0ACC6P514_9BURK
MTLAEICLLVACFLPIVCAGLAKRQGFGRPPADGGYDNSNPREWTARQQGAAARANAAQMNSFEALPLFIAAVLVAQQHGAAQGAVNALALAFVALRVAYIWAYISDRATLRSVLWAVASACAVLLFFV